MGGVHVYNRARSVILSIQPFDPRAVASHSMGIVSLLVAVASASLVLSGCVLANGPEAEEEPPQHLSASEVYARVAPSVAFIETSLGSGTGVLIDDDLVVTNAHVVWPFDEARVVFADGSEFDMVPVVAQDLMADLALIDLSSHGGAPVSAAPVRVSDGADVPIGEELYLVGYPSEVELYPQPAITKGILSRRRLWDTIDMPYLQTDAPIAGGQSGGALVAPDGSVVGISSMIFGEGEFGLALSAPHAIERVTRERAGHDVDGTDPRALPDGTGRRSATAGLAGTWDEAVFVIDTGYGEEVEVTVDSPADARLAALSPYGDLELDVNDTTSGREVGSILVAEFGPYFVVVSSDQAGDVAVTSTHPLMPLDDPDDGAELVPGRDYAGQMDFPGDIDYLSLELLPGESLAVTVDTVSLIPDVVVYRADDDSMAGTAADALIGGALGMSATAVVESDEGGQYIVIVRDYDALGTGAYLVRVE